MDDWKRLQENRTEADWHQRRKDLLNAKDQLWISSAPFLTMDRRELTKALVRLELFKKVLEIPGYIVECGSWRGNGLALYYHLSSIFEPYNFNRKIISFDTFSGFSGVTAFDHPKALDGDMSNTDLEFIQRCFEVQDLNRPIGHLPKVEFVTGDANTTIPEYVENTPELVVALLYLDFDIYQPTKVALEHLIDRVPIGGIIAFDEFAQSKWPGETLALHQILSIGKCRLERMAIDPNIAFFIKV